MHETAAGLRDAQKAVAHLRLAVGRNVVVQTEDDEALRAFGNVRPVEFRIAVFGAFRRTVFPDAAVREFRSDEGALGKRRGCDFHEKSPLSQI